MKTALLLIASLTLTNSAFAQTETTSVQKTEASQTQVETQIANDAALVKPVEKTTSAVNQEENQKKAFGITLFLIGGYSDKQFYGEKPSFDVFDSYVSFNYRASKDLRFGARPAFGYATEGFNKYGDETNNRARIRDFSFLMTMYNLFEDIMPLKTDLKFQPRVYLPTSDGSKDQGMIARLRTELELRYFIDKYSTIRYNISPSYYFQRNTVYLDNANPKKPNSLKTTSQADLEQTVELSWNMNKYYSIKPAIGFSEVWSNTSDLNSTREQQQFRKTSLLYGAGIEIRPVRNFNFTVGARTEKDLLNSDKSEETSYSIMTGATLY